MAQYNTTCGTTWHNVTQHSITCQVAVDCTFCLLPPPPPKNVALNVGIRNVTQRHGQSVTLLLGPYPGLQMSPLRPRELVKMKNASYPNLHSYKNDCVDVVNECVRLTYFSGEGVLLSCLARSFPSEQNIS